MTRFLLMSFLGSLKGQLISKGHFGFFNYLKKRTKNFCPSRLGQKFEFSSSLFWENWRHQKDISKLTDLQLQKAPDFWQIHGTYSSLRRHIYLMLDAHVNCFAIKYITNLHFGTIVICIKKVSFFVNRSHTNQNSFYNCTEISSLEIDIFDLKMMVKSGIIFLYFEVQLPSANNQSRKAELAWQVSR